MKKILTADFSIVALMIQLIIMIVFCLILPDLIFGKYNMKSTIIMLIILYSYSFMFQKIYLNKFNEAINLHNKDKFSESLIKFNEAYIFFNKHHIIDKFRYVIFLNISKKSYREMSLLNIAILYFEIGNEKASIQAYNKVLEFFPKSSEAKMALEDYNFKNQNSKNQITNDVQIPLNKKKILLFSLFSFLMLLSTPFILTDTNNSLLSKFIISIALLFVLITFIFFVFKLFDPKPGLIVTQKGFLDNTSLASFRFVEWKNVKSIKYSKEGKYNFVRINLSNFDEILINQSIHVRLIAKLNPKRYTNGFNISSSIMKCSLPELKYVLQNGRKRKNYA